MRQTTYITLNLQTPNYATVYAARDNLLSRYVSATLLDGSAPWTPPAGTYVEISYIKSDGTGGYYDTAEDGNLAYTITNNVVEFVLAQQALTVPGDVRMALDFFNADGDSLSTFTFVLTVPENSFPYAQLASGNYFNVMQAALAEMAQYIKTLQNGYGAPLVAPTAAAMTDKTRVYVYTGSESGYTNGNWYYWDGSAWVSGGIYNSIAFTTDKTLTISGDAADAAATGEVRDAFYDTLVLREAPAITIGSVWRSATGTAGSNAKYARTTGKLTAALYNIAETQSDTYRFGLGFYDVDGNPFGFVTVNTAPETQYVPGDAVQMIVNFNRKDNADMQDSDIEAIQSELKLYGVTDITLTQPNKPADAQVTGDIKSAVDATPTLAVGRATTIPDETDYDTLVTPGSYRVLTQSAAQTMINSPTKLAHRLYVLQIINNRIEQIVIGNSSGAYEYRRYYGGTSWSEWRRVAYTADIPTVDYSLSTYGDVAEASRTGNIRDAINAYGNGQLEHTGLLPTLWYRLYIANNGNESSPDTRTNDLATYYIPVSAGLTIKYNKTDTVNSVLAFEYAADKSFLRYVTLRAARTRYIVGADASFIRLSYKSSTGSPIMPDYASSHFIAYLESVETPDVIPLGLHERPKSQGVLNCIKRARQMTDIKWTVAADIDRVNIVSGQQYADAKNYFQNRFVAGRDYTGLPYSERNFIGVRKGLETFVSSAANQNSKECTNSQYTGNTSVASYYGTVCVTLVSYALHVPQISSPKYTNMPGLTKLYDLLTGGVYHNIDDMELCDVLWEHGHVAIITDIIRDASGAVTAVEVSESTKFGAFVKDNGNDDYGGKCRRKLWTKGEFLAWFASFAVYRYDSNLLASIPYTPCPYVPMIDEPQYVETAKLPCITEFGNKVYYFASSADSHNVRVLIRESGYSHLRVKQNGDDYALIDVTDLTEVTVSCTANKEALYEAYLCNVSNGAETTTSRSCYWLNVGQTTEPTIHANTDGSYTITYQRETDTSYPIAVIFNGTNASDGAFAQVTDYDKDLLADGKTKYTVTVTPPSAVSSVDSYSLLLDLYDYGWAATAKLTPMTV